MSSALVLTNGGASHANGAGPSRPRPRAQRAASPPYRSSLLPFTDALPYLDRELDQDEALRARVEREIKKEERRSDAALKQSIEERMGPAFEFSRNLSQLVQQEMERVERREPPSNALDTDRYALPAPADDAAGTEEGWDSALRNSAVQLAQQDLRLSNVELLKAYGANAWRIHNFQQEADVRLLEGAAEALKARTTELNRKRKDAQVGPRGVGERLTGQQEKWKQLISGNLQVEVANITAAHEIDALRAKRRRLQAELDELDREEQAES